MKLIVMMLCVVLYSAASAQNTDSISVLNEVTVSGVKKQTLKHTPFNVSSISLKQINNSVNFNVTDALARMPGISKISTGNGISKPIIRGVYGNRIQTVLLGLRFDNQQWQNEHGLGLSIIGIDRVEILKGPSSILYGTEAMGGVIRIVEEGIPEVGTKVSDVNASLYSNTAGFTLNAGMKKRSAVRNWRIRVGADSHADYSDGNNNRVLNSRFESYNLKATLGYSRKRWQNQNNFYSSFSRFGFIMNDNTDRKPVDYRFSRKLDGPFHAVLFNMISSENTIQKKNSKLALNGGVHSNLRLENEGGNHISLNMLLTTFSYNAKWYKSIRKGEIIFGNESQYQVNTNYGSRVIIPDAKLFESSMSLYLKTNHNNVDLEAGVSFSERNVSTSFTTNMNYSGGTISPFKMWFPSINGNAGISLNKGKWNIKLNEATGYRSPNLAELSSNGLHEGTFRYEIGNQKMKAEQNINSEININYESSLIDVYSAVYLNIFSNYIYLSPTGTQLYGFDIYRYLQGNARLYGSEISMHFKPTLKYGLEASYSTVTGKLVSGEYLPFIPADKVVTDFVGKPSSKIRFRIGADIITAQHHPGAFETSTAGYWLLHAMFSIIHNKKSAYTFSVTGENLLNKVYYDHLSRFKYFGIYNQGQCVTASLSIQFKQNNKL